MPEEAFLAIPIPDSDASGTVGILFLGTKPFGDFYSDREIRLLENFAFVLGLLVRQIATNERLRDLSANLDRKVDEKTMEYNDLINRQKEFISVISHEIKAPIANAIFQADGLLEDLEKPGALKKPAFKEELSLLNSQIARAGELITKLFSVQSFDVRPVELFRERIHVGRLLKTEFDVHSRLHERVRFEIDADSTLSFANIDRIQFQQVISNLLQNAVKFADPKNPEVRIEASRTDDGGFSVAVEDNGAGFENADPSELFEKYHAGRGNMAGL